MIPVEPSADVRRWAKYLRELYVALRAEGFTDDQALHFLAHFFRSD